MDNQSEEWDEHTLSLKGLTKVEFTKEQSQVCIENIVAIIKQLRL